MKNAVLADNISDESYVVEIDGRIESKHGVFVEALRAGLNVKQKRPLSDVKVRDVHFSQLLA